MNDTPMLRRQTIYSAKYFVASPTYEKWVKLTVADVHSLREEPGFEGQNMLFYLNHPIRFVSLVAPIVSIGDINPTTTLITLDDSSGSCIDVRITRRDNARAEPGKPNTTVKNMDINSSLGSFEIVIDGQVIDIGTVVKAKCTISNFRGVRQLDLKRISVVKETNEEVAAWAAMSRFKRDVMSGPWVLTPEERHVLDEREREEDARIRDAEQRQRQREIALRDRAAQREKKLRQHEERTEQRRRAAEENFNAGALI